MSHLQSLITGHDYITWYCHYTLSHWRSSV